MAIAALRRRPGRRAKAREVPLTKGAAVTDEVREETRPAKRPQSGVYPRDSVEFGRALTFFDAVFAVALTLLVTSLGHASTRSAWNSLR